MRKIFMMIERSDVTREYHEFEVPDAVGDKDICVYDYSDEPVHEEHIYGEEMDSWIMTEQEFNERLGRRCFRLEEEE